MQNKGNQTKAGDKKLAAVCGLYCKACTAYIATTEEPARLARLAAMFELSEEAIRCLGCRSSTRGPYCQTCKMSACAAQRGIDFCVECADYPCDHLEQFQSETPHRLELWDDLAQIEAIGWQKWLAQARAKYVCPDCGTINSAYDQACRTCGQEPSCGFVSRHRQAIAEFCRATGQ